MEIRDRSVEELRREVRITVGCPDCGAGQGERCIGRAGKVRVANHLGRLRAARDLGVKRQGSLRTRTAKSWSACARCGQGINPGEEKGRGPGLPEWGWCCSRCLDAVR